MASIVAFQEAQIYIPDVEIVQHRPVLNSKPFRSTYVEKEYSTADSDSFVGWGR